MLLADSAQAVDGKLYVLGGGWTVTGPKPTRLAIALTLELDPDQVGKQQHLRLDLMDEETGELVPGPEEGYLHMEVGFVYSASEETPAGAPANAVFAFELGPQQTILPGRRYRWRLTLNGRHDPGWVLPFVTLPAPEEGGA